MPTELLFVQPAAPSPPQPPAPIELPGTPVIAGTSRSMTAEEVSALKARRNELSSQLRSAKDRRSEAVGQLRNSPEGAARIGLEQRIQLLDKRILQIETDIATNGQALAAAPGALLNTEVGAPVVRYGPFSSGQLTGITIVSIVLVWAPLAFAAARIMTRRWAQPKPAPQILESAARLERMEQAIDAVAIEVERISEGQRFVTQTMAKREAVPALGVGQAGRSPES
jgi:hypothetical protein